MPIAVHASSPARVTAAAAAATTAQFSPPVTSIIVAIIHANSATTTSVTCAMSNTGTALTWNIERVSNFGSSAQPGGTFIVWAENANAQTNITVTATTTNNFAGNLSTSIRSWVLTGAASPPNGAGNSGGSTTNNLTTGAVITTGVNSYLFAGGTDWNTLGNPTSSDLTGDGFTQGTNISGYGGYEVLTSSGASITANLDAAGTTAAAWTWAVLEIKAAGGATLQGTASLIATATLSATISRSTFPTVSLIATPTLSANIADTVQASASLIATPTLSANGVRVTAGSTTLIATPTLTANGIRTTFGSVNCIATVTLSVNAVQSSPSVPVGLARSITLHLMNANGTYRCRLLDYVDLNFSREVASKGAVNFKYPEMGNNFAALREFVDQAKQAEFRLWINGSSAQYQLGGYLSESSKDDVDPQRMWTFAGHFYEQRTEEAILYPVVGVDNGETIYGNTTPGDLITIEMTKIKARGTLTDITTSTFSSTTDSNGVTWPSPVSAKFSPGTTLKEVLDELRDKGFIEYEVTATKQLKLYVPASWGVDRTVTPPKVILTSAKSISSSPRKYSAKGMATHLLVVGADALKSTQSNAAALTKLGRQVEIYESAGNLSTQGAVTAYAQLKATGIGDAQYEVTHELNLHDLAPMPLEDFNLGDWLWSDTPNAISKERLQVAQFTMAASSANELSGSVSLNSLFFTQAQQLKRRLDKLAAGSVIPGTSNPPSQADDTIAPTAPTALTASSQHYMDTVGSNVSNVTFGWTAPATNTDSSIYSDHSHYLPEWRYAAGQSRPTSWIALPEVPGTSVNFDADADVNLELRVRAVDRSGNMGVFSSTLTTLTVADSTAPPVPSAPVVTTFLRQLIVDWDGLGSAGESMPIDYDHVELYWSTINNFSLAQGTLFDNMVGKGGRVFDGAAYGTTYYFKLRSVDHLGNFSTLSTQGSATGTRAIADDIGDLVITAAKMANLQPLGPKISSEQISTPHLTVATFSDSLIPNGTFLDPDLTGTLPAMWTKGTDTGGTHTLTRDTTAADTWAGGATLKFTMSAASGTLEAYSDSIPITPGDNLYVELVAKASRVIPGVDILISLSDVDPVVTTPVAISSDISLSTTYPASSPVEANYTVPSTFASQVPKYARITIRVGGVVGDAAAFTVWLAEVRVRKTVGTAEIQDLAVSRAKIGLLQVGDAQFESASAGKITTGTLTATVTNSGMIRTASSGARTEQDSAGIRLYNSSGTLVVNLSTSTGNALLTGQVQTALTGERMYFNPSGTNPDEARFYPSGAGDYARIMARTAPSDGTAAILIDGGAAAATGRGRVGAYKGEAFISHVTSDTGGDTSDGFSRTAVSCNINDIQNWAQNKIFWNKYSGSSFVSNSQLWLMWATGTLTNCPVLGATAQDAGIKFDSATAAATNAIGTLFGPFKCSALTQTSSQDAKTEVTDIRSILNPKQLIKNSRSKKYKLTAEVDAHGSQNAHVRFGPVAEDLPSELIWMTPTATGSGFEPSVSLGDQVGVIWGALGQLLDERDVQSGSVKVPVVTLEPQVEINSGALYELQGNLYYKNSLGQVRKVT